jgi:hypothetical protein
MGYKTFGVKVDFSKCTQTLQEVFGKEAIIPPVMTKKLWDFIKKEKLMAKE